GRAGGSREVEPAESDAGSLRTAAVTDERPIGGEAVCRLREGESVAAVGDARPRDRALPARDVDPAHERRRDGRRRDRENGNEQEKAAAQPPEVSAASPPVPAR